MANRYYSGAINRGEDARLGKIFARGSDGSSAMYEGSQMISEDRSAPCLLPRNVIDRDWPRGHNYISMGEADLFMGVQKQLHKDQEDMRREFNPKKY